MKVITKSLGNNLALCGCLIQRVAAAIRNDTHGGLMFVATLKLKTPPNYDHVVYPERRRLKVIDKIPPLDPSTRPPKHPRQLIHMRGPEQVHNKLMYGDYGIQAITGGRLKHKDTEAIRLIVTRQLDERNMFAVWRFSNFWQSVTKKGQGQRMGGGKGSIDHYCFPFKAERIILEIGGHCEFREVFPILKAIQKILPFWSRLVSHENMKAKEEKERWEEENNINPFTFKYCADNNILGCRKHLGPYDYIWHNKYR